MRRFCRNVDIKDIEFIKRCIYKWLDKKKGRDDVQRFLSAYAGLSYRRIKEAVECEDYSFLEETVNRIAKDVQQRIINRKLDLPPIRYKRKYDEASGKWRLLGIQEPIHQIFDYITVEGCMEMFFAKIGPYQMASIPKRGQEKGAKVIQKWLRLDEKHTRHYVQADVRKCYPSINHDVLKAMFARDIKNPELLWFVYELLDAFDEGLSIGSHFSQYACNYYLSLGYHFASEQLSKERRKRGGGTERTRLVYHVLFYMDDVLFLGSSKKDVELGMEMFERFMLDKLKLHIKPNWKSEKVDYIGKDGNHHGSFIDMMGYRIYRDHITVRRKTFKKIRRNLLRADAKIKAGKEMPLDLAYRIISYCGKIEHSNSFEFVTEHNVGRIKSQAEKVISNHDKQLAEEKKRRKLDYEHRKNSLSGEAGEIAIQPDWDQSGRMLDSQEYCPHSIPHIPF